MTGGEVVAAGAAVVGADVVDAGAVVVVVASWIGSTDTGSAAPSWPSASAAVAPIRAESRAIVTKRPADTRAVCPQPVTTAMRAR